MPTSTPSSCSSTTRTRRCCSASGPSWRKRCSRSSTGTGPERSSRTRSSPAWPSSASPGSRTPATAAPARARCLTAWSRWSWPGPIRRSRPSTASTAAWRWARSTCAARTSRDGEGWVLDGSKKWIGNASFADLTVIWARDVDDGQVKGFVVEAGTPGFTTRDLEDKIALRVVQNALITLDGVRVPEANRLQRATSFRDTAEVLRVTRAGVAWMAVGCARGAYEHALDYAAQRQQFGRPIGGFQLVQDLLVKMLGNITASATLCAGSRSSRPPAS